MKPYTEEALLLRWFLRLWHATRFVFFFSCCLIYYFDSVLLDELILFFFLLDLICCSCFILIQPISFVILPLHLQFIASLPTR
ncbi:hypothetical protein GLYMA_19G176800v4 [Glycine max]|uniref:Uncharacterized protein n=2 Tax=Glycine subgen. Soja TaxID=1462606 RepID=A0A0R0EP41_SOYBN|nr:hypothetical protein GYH30_053391 [Glycine max]KRG95897.1 hypothetical protein GLYMA_19G176800v4 [Glycine max]RZB48456.1 hypothetical protein D0Y65_051799 [Glycine soja]